MISTLLIVYTILFEILYIVKLYKLTFQLNHNQAIFFSYKVINKFLNTFINYATVSGFDF